MDTMTDTSTSLLVTTLQHAAFVKAIAKLNRKARRLQLPPIRFVRLEDVIKKQRRSVRFFNGIRTESIEREVDIECRQYELSHVSDSQKGWSLVGRITRSPEGGPNFVESFKPTFNRDDFLQVDAGHCDHCMTRRHRKHTWIIQHENGRIMQVGSSCLRDLLGGFSAAALEFQAFLYGYFGWDSGKDFWDPCNDMREPEFCDIKYVIASTLAVIEAEGWIDTVRDCYNEVIVEGTNRFIGRLVREGREIPAKVTPKHISEAEALITSITELDGTEDEFLSELQYFLKCNSALTVRAGLIAYAPRYLERRKVREAEEAIKAQSEHVGEVGERDTFEFTCNEIRQTEGFGGSILNIHIFRDSDDNILVWKTGSRRLKKGNSYKAKATVKRHTEFAGAKQTELSRVSTLLK